MPLFSLAVLFAHSLTDLTHSLIYALTRLLTRSLAHSHVDVFVHSLVSFFNHRGSTLLYVQSQMAAYLRSALSIIKPHLQPLAAQPTWGQQLAANSPALSTEEDSVSPWVWAHPPSPPQEPLLAQGNGQQGCSSTNLPPIQLGVTATAKLAMEGIVRLSWILLCRDQLTMAWTANMECAQNALLTRNSEV